MTMRPSRWEIVRVKRNQGLETVWVSAFSCTGGSTCTRTVCRASRGPPSARGLVRACLGKLSIQSLSWNNANPSLSPSSAGHCRR